MAKLGTDEIEKAYSKLNTQVKIYDENKEYVKGANPKILRQQRMKDPDNRIPVPLAKSAVIDLTGYAGSNITIEYEPVDVKNTDENKLMEYQALMRKFEEHNDDDIITAALYKESISHTETYLLFWVSDEMSLPNGMLTPEYTIVGTDRIVLIWDNNLKPNLLAACDFRKLNDTKYCDIYYPLFKEQWVTKGGGKWMRNREGDTTYPYTKVPIIPFKMGIDGGPVFQAEKAMIDKHDSVISKAQNEMDRFNALIALFPFEVTPEFVQALNDKKIIDMLNDTDADKWPKYLEKNLTNVNEYTQNHINRLERLIHKTMKIVDFSEIAAQGGDESGVARAFKLLGMEFLATGIEKVFTKGFYERTELFNDIIKAGTSGIDTDLYTIEVTAKRNLPLDELARIQIAEGLKRLGVSDETVIKMLPMIKDPEKEIQAMEEARQRNAEQFSNILDGGNDGEEEI